MEVRAQLTSLHQLCGELFDSLASLADPSSTSSVKAGSDSKTPQDIVQAILEADTRLQVSLKSLDAHQDFHRKLEELRAQVSGRKRAISEAVELLCSAEHTLRAQLDEARPRLEAIAHAEKHQVDEAILLTYAHKVSYATAAPPNWSEGRPLDPFQPPFRTPNPLQANMMAGRLYQQLSPTLSRILSRRLPEWSNTGHPFVLPSGFTQADLGEDEQLPIGRRDGGSSMRGGGSGESLVESGFGGFGGLTFGGGGSLSSFGGVLGGTGTGTGTGGGGGGGGGTEGGGSSGSMSGVAAFGGGPEKKGKAGSASSSGDVVMTEAEEDHVIIGRKRAAKPHSDSDSDVDLDLDGSEDEDNDESGKAGGGGGGGSDGPSAKKAKLS